MSIKAEKVSVFHSGRQVLAEVSFALPESGIVSLVGENGAGKSTLLQLCAGITAPSKGEVFLGTEKVRKLVPLLRAKKLAYLSQHARCTFPCKVLDFLCMSRYPYQENSSSAQQKVKAHASKFGIEEFLDRSVLELSGGERQSVFLTATFVQDTQVVLLDEPFNGLDPKMREEWYHLFLQEVKERNMLIFMTTHHLSSALLYSDWILGLHKGNLLASCAAQEFVQRKIADEIFGEFGVILTHPTSGIPIRVPKGR